MNEVRHLGVYAVIIKDEKILLIKKSRGAYIGKLDLPGGGIEFGETPIETLKREIFEETGCIVKESNLLLADSVIVKWIHHEKPEKLHHIGIIYEARIDNDDIKTIPDGHDSLGANWHDINKLTKNLITPLTIKSLEHLGYKLNK